MDTFSRSGSKTTSTNGSGRIGAARLVLRHGSNLPTFNNLENRKDTLHHPNGYHSMHRKPRIITPFGETVVLVIMLAVALIMNRCGTTIRPRFAAAMPIAHRTSTDPAASRS